MRERNMKFYRSTQCNSWDNFFLINKWLSSQSGESWIQCYLSQGCLFGGKSFSLLSFFITIIEPIKKFFRFQEINIMQEMYDILYLFQYDDILPTQNYL